MSTWVVVTDTRRARIFADAGRHADLAEIADLVNPVSHQGPVDDDRGRGFDGRGGIRHGLEPKTLPGEHDLRQFARDVAAYLEREFNANRFTELVLVAAPDWLGHLRQALHDSVRTVVRDSIGKDLVRCTPAEIAGHLRAGH